jgi:hypothetical protein
MFELLQKEQQLLPQIYYAVSDGDWEVVFGVWWELNFYVLRTRIWGCKGLICPCRIITACII